MEIIPGHEEGIPIAPMDSSTKSLKSKKTSIFQFQFLKSKINENAINNKVLVENERRKSFFDKIEGENAYLLIYMYIQQITNYFFL